MPLVGDAAAGRDQLEHLGVVQERVVQVRMPLQLAEVLSESDVLRHVQMLVRKEEDLMIKQQAADRCGFLGAGLRQRQIVDLGAEGPGETDDSMAHGSSPAVWSNEAISNERLLCLRQRRRTTLGAPGVPAGCRRRRLQHAPAARPAPLLRCRASLECHFDDSITDLTQVARRSRLLLP